MIDYLSDKRETFAGGWVRNVCVDGIEYACRVERGKRVRIPYKPRGKNHGCQWHGSVYRYGRDGGYVWSGRVPGSIGCRGLLKQALIIKEEE